MKYIHKIAVLVFVMSLFVACKEEDKQEIKLSGITDVTTFQEPGKIGISWKRVEPVNFEYIRINYYDHLTKKNRSILASKYTDTIIIPDTRAKYGDYKFTFQPFSSTETGGEVVDVVAKSGAAPKTITVVGEEQLTLKADGLFTDAQDPGEGPIKDLIDGNQGTFFHMNWHQQTPFPHYIVVDLGKEVEGFKFSYTTRKHNNVDDPKKMTLFGSTTFDGTTFDPTTAVEIGMVEGLPKGNAVSYNSENFILNNKIRFLWFRVDEGHGSKNFIALSELSVTELQLKIIDPEAPDA